MPENADLRPTPDRVRETLFNWLQPGIAGSRCLDLYAGTGVLGWEALSRGAASVTMVEKNIEAADMLERQAEILQTEQVRIVRGDAEIFLRSAAERFDVVFVDPPFSKNLLYGACDSLLNRGHLRPDALVYVENDREIKTIEGYTTEKQARAGRVFYKLLRGPRGAQMQA